MSLASLPLALLLLSPTLAADAELRLVSTGTGDAPVEWHLDGVWVATTNDTTPATVPVAAGAHELTAASAAGGPWTVLARPEPDAPGVSYVPGWTATYAPGPPVPGAWSTPWAPVAVALGALTALLWPRRTTKQPREA